MQENASSRGHISTPEGGRVAAAATSRRASARTHTEGRSSGLPKGESESEMGKRPQAESAAARIFGTCNFFQNRAPRIVLIQHGLAPA